MAKKSKSVAFIPTTNRGSKLEGKGPASGNHKQPQGKSIGAATKSECGYGRSSHMSELKGQR